LPFFRHDAFSALERAVLFRLWPVVTLCSGALLTGIARSLGTALPATAAKNCVMEGVLGGAGGGGLPGVRCWAGVRLAEGWERVVKIFTGEGEGERKESLTGVRSLVGVVGHCCIEPEGGGDWERAGGVAVAVAPGEDLWAAVVKTRGECCGGREVEGGCAIFMGD
jgi:hypothetical protein